MMLEVNKRLCYPTSFAAQEAYFLNKTINYFIFYRLVLSFVFLRAGLT
jgi:hypothetical protein